ncbi:hypothetical protein PSPO_a1209 [Pseudoalteromonas spongiae UST010723-006]|nr:hypothetical protein PSPO_a1209 [Pseudoalteromonas spongiae UST010723-006]
MILILSMNTRYSLRRFLIEINELKKQRMVAAFYSIKLI